MPLIVPGVCRYTINGAFGGGRDFANIIDMAIDTTGTNTARDDAIFDQAGVIINQWVNDVLPVLSGSHRFDSVSWVDLDEADGSVGERITTDTESLPQFGGIVGSSLPANTSVLVSKVTTRSRGARNGRMYVGFVAESHTSGPAPNQLDAAPLALWQTAFDNFKSNVEQEGALNEYQSQLNVVHVTARDAAGNPTAGVGTPVSELEVQAVLATQRRRLRG